MKFPMIMGSNGILDRGVEETMYWENACRMSFSVYAVLMALATCRDEEFEICSPPPPFSV
jgi:hypothetical protein